MQKIMFNDKYGLTEAVLAKRKTQTRRAVNDWEMMKLLRKFDSQGSLLTLYERFNLKPKLRELFILNRRVMHYRRNEIIAIAQPYKDVYFHPSIKRPRPDMETEKGWSNKMFVRAEDMPHHIRITKIRVERLQDISEDDCLKEGIKEIYENGVDDSSEFYGYAYLPDATPCVDETYNYPQEAYASLIDRISGKGTWEGNPYVFVYDFELID